MKKLKKIFKISLIIVCVLIVIFITLVFIESKQSNTYSGGYAPNGSYCDYGYHVGIKDCCDEDDYSCELCDKYDIYCGDTSIIQGIDDMDHYPSKIDGGDYNCSSFISWEDAQKVFIRDNGIKNDPYNLDRDKDGIACESKKRLSNR
jgi:hypothetical protein